MKKLRLELTKQIDPDFEESAKTAKAAYERLDEHTQHYAPVDDLWALDTATSALQELYGFEED